MFKDLVVYSIIMPVSLLVGAIIGWFTCHYILKRQIKEWKKKIEEPDKEQVRNMLSALGKKPSEEQVNRFINMAKNSKEKANNKPKKTSDKK